MWLDENDPRLSPTSDISNEPKAERYVLYVGRCLSPGTSTETTLISRGRLAVFYAIGATGHSPPGSVLTGLSEQGATYGPTVNNA